MRIESFQQLVLLLLLICFCKADLGTKCNFFEGDAFFSLDSATNFDEDYFSEALETRSELQEDGEIKEIEYKHSIYFNFCRIFSLTYLNCHCYRQDLEEIDCKPAYAVMRSEILSIDGEQVSDQISQQEDSNEDGEQTQTDNEDSDCNQLIRLTSSSSFSNYRHDPIDEDDLGQGVSMQMIGGDRYMDTYKQYYFSVKIHCDDAYYDDDDSDDDQEDTENDTDDSQDDEEEPNLTILRAIVIENAVTIEAVGSSGCPKIWFSEIWQFFHNNNIIFAIVLIVIGLLECFFGLRLIKPTLFLVGFFTGFGFLIALLGEFVLQPKTEMMVVYALFIVIVVFGCLLGFITMTIPKLGFFCLGVWLGVIIAFTLNNTAIHSFDSQSNHASLWITIAIFGVSIGVLTLSLWQHLTIISTGFVGAYCMIRPFGFFLGGKGFPNELQLAQQIQNNDVEGVSGFFYLYMALVVIIGGLGIAFQYKVFYNKDKKEYEVEVSSKKESSVHEQEMQQFDPTDLNKPLIGSSKDEKRSKKTDEKNKEKAKKEQEKKEKEKKEKERKEKERKEKERKEKERKELEKKEQEKKDKEQREKEKKEKAKKEQEKKEKAQKEKELQLKNEKQKKEAQKKEQERLKLLEEQERVARIKAEKEAKEAKARKLQSEKQNQRYQPPSSRSSGSGSDGSDNSGSYSGSQSGSDEEGSNSEAGGSSSDDDKQYQQSQQVNQNRFKNSSRKLENKPYKDQKHVVIDMKYQDQQAKQKKKDPKQKGLYSDIFQHTNNDK